MNLRSMDAVSVNQLSKSFGSVTPLRGCTFSVPAGCVFGLLGQNGAGKTTLLRTLLGYLHPSSGGAKVCGYDILTQSLAVRSSVSYLPGDARLYRTLKGRAVLELFAGLHHFGNFEHSLQIAKRLDLDIHRRVMFMSTGMRQKLALALVMGCRAPLVILDEPTANLDPNVREVVLELVREVRDDGRTVILSSHIFSDIDDTCDRVAVLRGGDIVVQQDMHQLGKLHIVTGEWSGPTSEAKDRICNLPAILHAFVSRAETQLAVELHIQGEPNTWMTQLAELNLRSLSIERAGIRAVYQRFHDTNSREDWCDAA